MTAIDHPELPPGQYTLDHFPRFGLSQFARRFPVEIGKVELQIAGLGSGGVVDGDSGHVRALSSA